MLDSIRFDPRWRLSERARALPCMKPGSATLWEKDAGKEANAAAREMCAMHCPFRVDCYMTSYLAGDNGVIRGGVMLVGRVRMNRCVRCGLPSVRAGRRRLRSLCAVCVCVWDCHGCGKRFFTDRQHEPRSLRQYHSEECRLQSMTRRIMMARQSLEAA